MSVQAMMAAVAGGATSALVVPPLTNTATFNYTGAVQTHVISATATFMQFEAMGAAGGDGGSAGGIGPGGPGGYVSGIFPLNGSVVINGVTLLPGITLSVVVGAGGLSAGFGVIYGFGGGARLGDGMGGGLSGVFLLGGAEPAATDAAFAAVVAGGGGGTADVGGPTGGNLVYLATGAPGGDPAHSGGMPTMQADGNPSLATDVSINFYMNGGGGGYTGGIRTTSRGDGTSQDAKGGANYVDPQAITSADEFTAFGSSAQVKANVAPWDGGVGQCLSDVYGQDGRVIISYD